MSCIDCNGLTLLTQRIESQDGNFSKKKSTTMSVVVSSAANFFGLNKNSTLLELTYASKTGSSLIIITLSKIPDAKHLSLAISTIFLELKDL